jgi:hypothetical protein
MLLAFRMSGLTWDAVSEYVFRPFWLNGDLVDVLTVFQVDFHLPGMKK